MSTSTSTTITNLETVRTVFGTEVHDELKAAIAAWFTEHDPSGDIYTCADNFRVALWGDDASMEHYEARIEEGCCGCIDTVFRLSGDRAFLWGFNYGH